MNNPLVSISCITYNHAPYIRQCLDGLLMQQCDFEYEILINDDASTDGTQEIIKEYEKKYPEIIKPIFQSENQYLNGVRGMMARFNFPRAKGKYIALCEGDDYWTDPLKLHKQIDFMDVNAEVSLIFGNAEVVLDGNEADTNYFKGYTEIIESAFFTGVDILENWTIPTGTVLFRKKDLGSDFIDIVTNPKLMFGDIVLFQYMATKGKLYGMKDYLSVYRRHSGGVTNFKLNVDFDIQFYNHLRELIKVFGNQLKTPTIKKMLANFSLSIALNYLRNGKIFGGLCFLLQSIRYKPSHFLNYLRNFILKKTTSE